MIRIGAAALVAFLTVMAGCEVGTRVLRMHVQNYQGIDPGELVSVFEQRAGIRLERIAAEPGESSMEALLSGKADLALVSNSTPFTAGIRAVLPAYEGVLHVLVREGVTKEDVILSLRNMHIYVANNSRAGREVVRVLAERQGLEPGDYAVESTFVPGTTDVIIYFGPVDPSYTTWFRPGYRFLEGSATARDNIPYVLPRMRAVVIPANTYSLPGNEVPIYTISVMTLMVTRKDLPEQLIYELTRALIEQKPRFTAIAPSVFSSITDKFDPLDLAFPLHTGARRYLERDEPSLLERYAETINMLVYVSFLVLTGCIGVIRWRAHRKRDRIDSFYTRTLLLRKQAIGSNHADLIDKLDALEEEAITSLIEGKLAANESFRIFTELLTRTRSELMANGTAQRASRKPDPPAA